MKFVITGGNFNNKGAQAMTFIVCSELRKSFPDCEIVMADTCYTGDKPDNNLLFSRIQDCLSTRMILGGNLPEHLLARIIWFIKKIRNHTDLGLSNLYSAFNNCDAIFDVSGYAVGSNMSYKVNFIYIFLLKIAYKENIPLYIMPQSFGPLKFSGFVGKYIDRCYSKYLKKARIIFPREKEGLDMLVERYCLNNVVLSRDIVLQNRELEYSLILNNPPEMDTNNYSREYVGIIPSSNNYIFDNRDKIDKYYIDIINYLLNEGEKVFIAYHSGNDRLICKRLKSFFADNTNVVFDDHEYEFYEFKNLTRNFKYMVSSRYHSIVLAYKESTPCIIFAWATKYHELANYFLQNNYILNMETISNSEIIVSKIKIMQNNWLEESKNIQYKLSQLNVNSCFKICFNDLRKED